MGHPTQEGYIKSKVGKTCSTPGMSAPSSRHISRWRICSRLFDSTTKLLRIRVLSASLLSYVATTVRIRRPWMSAIHVSNMFQFGPRSCAELPWTRRSCYQRSESFAWYREMRRTSSRSYFLFRFTVYILIDGKESGFSYMGHVLSDKAMKFNFFVTFDDIYQWLYPFESWHICIGKSIITCAFRFRTGIRTRNEPNAGLEIVRHIS